MGDPVFGMPGDRVGQRGLAGAVRPHDGVDLAVFHGQVDAAQDLTALIGRIHHADVQVADFQSGHRYLNLQLMWCG
jgi:hypothetical protein